LADVAEVPADGFLVTSLKLLPDRILTTPFRLPELGLVLTMANVIDDWPCPRCGAPVSATVGNAAIGDQLAVSRRTCPQCGAALVHLVEGHLDRGWHRDEQAAERG
jgi:ribosomal protein S27AE